MRTFLVSFVGLLGVFSLPALAEFQSSGSAFAVGDGSIVVTANHVVDGCTSPINVPDVGTASMVKSDRRADLAILKLSHPLPTALRFRSGHPVKLGEEIVVIGYPLHGVLASPPTVTTGIVSSLAGLRDDPTEMQISAPVQQGNSGGPVLDRGGNVVGVVESKLDAIRAAMITGDIPQNINFAIHASIVTSLLDSYAINYDVGTFDTSKPVADIVSAAIPAVVVLECEQNNAPPAIAANPTPPPPQQPPPNPMPQPKSATLCGQGVEYVLDPADTSGFVGVWTGTWNNTSRLCGALVVNRVSSDGQADITYIYGPSSVTTTIQWKQQHAEGFIKSNVRSFKDDQGSDYKFFIGTSGGNFLDAEFFSSSGELKASFTKLN